ncbi:MAG TPA: circadian clock protein KaiC, partial [Thermoanaerobaculia bacterium]|nr:circadian clock protein KaiC [Thermoanaerobaculia bacterium]
EVRQAISTVKRRGGSHERSVRELQIGPVGIHVGRQLREFNGILTGRLDYIGGAGPLLGADGHTVEL